MQLERMRRSPGVRADGTDLRIGQVGFQGLNLLGGAHCTTAPSLPSPTNGFRGIGGSPKAIAVRGTDRDAGDHQVGTQFCKLGVPRRRESLSGADALHAGLPERKARVL